MSSPLPPPLPPPVEHLQHPQPRHVSANAMLFHPPQQVWAGDIPEEFQPFDDAAVGGMDSMLMSAEGEFMDSGFTNPSGKYLFI